MFIELSQAKVRLFKSLLDKRYRAKHNLFSAPGRKLLAEGLAAGFVPEAIVLAAPQAEALYRALLAQIADLGAVLPPDVPVYTCLPPVLADLCDQVQPEGVLAVWPLPALPPPDVQVTGPAFVLDDIRDPGNLGTLLRTADWFGHPVLYAGRGTVDAFNPKVVRAAMGALFRVPVVEVPDLPAFVAQHAARTVAAVLPDDTSGAAPLSAVPPDADFILLGSEAHGLSAELLAVKGLRRVAIPRQGRGESLNVAAAAAILAYQKGQAQA